MEAFHWLLPGVVTLVGASEFDLMGDGMERESSLTSLMPTTSMSSSASSNWSSSSSAKSSLSESSPGRRTP